MRLWVESLYAAVINAGEGRGSENVASLKTSFIGLTFYFSPELLSLHIEEKLIELCPGYDVFFPFSPPPPRKYAGLGEVSSSGFWNSFPLQLLLSELFSFLSPTSTAGPFFIFSGIKGSFYVATSLLHWLPAAVDKVRCLKESSEWVCSFVFLT